MRVDRNKRDGAAVAGIGIPAGPDGLTPDWLTRALRSGGVLGGGAVARVESELLEESGGFAGRIARLRVAYDRSDPQAPGTMIAKLHSRVDAIRQLLRRLRAPERELRFYREVAGRLALRTPALYYGDCEADSGRFVLLLEDLAPARAGDPVAGCPPAQVEQAMRSAAALHAQWWGSAELASMDWIAAFEQLSAARHELGRQVWAPFLQKYGGRLPPRFMQVNDRLRRGLNHAREELSRAPPTLLHGDYRPDNLLFGTEGRPAPLATVDWQVCMRGPGVCDIAYFLVACGSPEQRRAIEPAALETYRGELIRRGVEGYSLEQCRRDYRLAMVDIAARVAVLTMGLGAGNEQGRVLLDGLAERAAAALVDLDCVELLPS